MVGGGGGGGGRGVEPAIYYSYDTFLEYTNPLHWYISCRISQKKSCCIAGGKNRLSHISVRSSKRSVYVWVSDLTDL